MPRLLRAPYGIEYTSSLVYIPEPFVHDLSRLPVDLQLILLKKRLEMPQQQLQLIQTTVVWCRRRNNRSSGSETSLL
jgi:hypothetical protein